MTHVSKIKQCRHVDDNQVNQLFKADETKDYYQGQALKIDSWVVSPVTAVSDIVFWVCETTCDSSAYGFEVNVRQPRVGDTYSLETDFDLAESNVGTYYGIKPDGNGGYQISSTWEKKQWRLITVLWVRVGEFEFERYEEAGAAADNAEALENLVTSWAWAPATTPAAVGLFYVDTSNKKLYVSVATTASTDWTILN